MCPPLMHSFRRFVLLLLPVLLASFLSTASVRAQRTSDNRSRQIEIDVTVHDSSGEVLSVAATVALYLNGTPCGEQSTSSGRVTFITNDPGKYSAVVQAAGYKTGQNEISVSEPIRAQLDVSLQRDDSSSSRLLATAFPVLAPKAKDALDNALQSLRENHLDDAQKHLNVAARLAPSDPQVLYAQGLLHLSRHDFPQAQAALEKVIQMQPASASALSALGMALCDQKKYDQAIPPLEKSLALNPAAGWQTRWSLAESYYQGKRFDDALKVAMQAQSDADGQIPQVDLLLARALTAVGKYDDSAKVLRELLKNHGDAPEAATAHRFLQRLSDDGKISQP